MKVYILLLYTKHEGYEIVGVYDSWGKAEDAQEDTFKDNWYDIEEWVIC